MPKITILTNFLSGNLPIHLLYQSLLVYNNVSFSLVYEKRIAAIRTKQDFPLAVVSDDFVLRSCPANRCLSLFGVPLQQRCKFAAGNRNNRKINRVGLLLLFGRVGSFNI
ncbi:MAG: hypothetical protein LBU34_07035 [Planctomycetaceae bacterium]|nr:hypothetical protein [Planctomycetaceae bacterium]